MKYTIKDVAKEAKVSIATVSYVINGMDKVKKETKERILQAINKLNYVPDQTARNLINKKTKTVGMLVPLLSNEYWAKFAEDIQKKLLVKGYALLIGTSNTETVDLTVKTFLERNVDGIIIGTLGFTMEADNYIQMFIEKGLPIVTIAPTIHKDVTSVWGDILSSSMAAVNHLIQLGHQKIAYIGTITTGIERELGYRNALMIGNIPIDESIIISGRTEQVHYFGLYGYRSVKQLVLENLDFTALFCANDLIAIGAIKALAEMGINVPEDKAVVGFDDISMAGLYLPSLTTVKQPTAEMAEAAAELLIEQIENPKERFPVKKITFPMELIIRESSGRAKNKS